MTINNCIVIIVINISHKYQIRKTMKKTCIKCRKYYKNFKSVTQIKNHRNEIYQNHYKKIYQTESMDLNKYGIFFTFQYGNATHVSFY